MVMVMVMVIVMVMVAALLFFTAKQKLDYMILNKCLMFKLKRTTCKQNFNNLRQEKKC